MFANIEPEETCSASSVLFYLKHHNIQIPSENHLQSKEKLQVCPGVIALKILLIMKSDSKSVKFKSDIINFL